MSPVTIILFSIFAFIVSFWIRCRKRSMNVFEKYGIPGPKPNFITGNLIEFNEKREKCIDEWMKKYGNIFGFFLGGIPFIVCFDIEFVKFIQIKEYKRFINRKLLTPDGGLPHRVILEGLPIIKDDKWRTVRNIMSPIFCPGKMKMIGNLISDSINIFLEKITKNKDESVEMHEYYKKLTIDILTKTAMGVETNVQEGEGTKFLHSMETLFAVDTVDVLVMISVCFPEFEPIPTYIRRIVASVKYIINYPCVNYVMNTLRNIINSRKKSGLHQPDFLQMMIDAEEDMNGVKRKLTTDCIIANSAVFLLAGYDTTANSLAWCTYYIAKYPEIQEKIRQEISDNIEGNKDIEYADLSNLKYLDQVISETLRLHTVNVFTITRICSENVHYNNITLPENVGIVIPARNIHRDQNNWKEPLKFDPERFSSENIGNIDPSTYQPFGAGPRYCIGMRMAQMVMKLTLANLIRRFELEMHGNSEIEEEYTFFIIRPKNGINVKLTEIVL